MRAFKIAFFLFPFVILFILNVFDVNSALQFAVMSMIIAIMALIYASNVLIYILKSPLGSDEMQRMALYI